MDAKTLKEQGYLQPYVPMCPDCLVLMVEHDGGWFCPYALAAKATFVRQPSEAQQSATPDEARTSTVGPFSNDSIGGSR